MRKRQLNSAHLFVIYSTPVRKQMSLLFIHFQKGAVIFLQYFLLLPIKQWRILLLHYNLWTWAQSIQFIDNRDWFVRSKTWIGIKSKALRDAGPPIYRRERCESEQPGYFTCRWPHSAPDDMAEFSMSGKKSLEFIWGGSFEILCMSDLLYTNRRVTTQEVRLRTNRVVEIEIHYSGWGFFWSDSNMDIRASSSGLGRSRKGMCVVYFWPSFWGKPICL